MRVPVLMPHQRNNFELVKKSNHKIDLIKLTADIKNLTVSLHKTYNQLSLQMKKDAKDPWYESCGSFELSKPEKDYNLIIPELKGTYIEEMFESLPFKPIRSRLMKLNPKSCYSIHEDPDARYHIAILTNPKAKFVFTKKEKLFHIPADEHLYWVDTREEHTFINGSLDSSRLHLIMGYDNDIL